MRALLKYIGDGSQNVILFFLAGLALDLKKLGAQQAHPSAPIYRVFGILQAANIGDDST
jgi:hypothetical protein